ncbi:MAG: hypothetical protein B6D61_05100, partial [Bacteroidetes bacterium 4484_249]
VNNNKPQLSEFDKQVNKAINSFKQKMAYYRENPQLKSSETVPADSALWYLEATINYAHAFPNDYYDEMQSDEHTLVVPKNSNGEVDMDVLTQKYYEMKAEITNVYNNSGYADKGLALVDLTETAQTDDEITLNVETVTGEKGAAPDGPTPYGGPFEAEDDWWYGEDAGYCYDPYGVQDDADHQLFLATKDLIPDPNGNYFFINEFSFTVEGGDPDMRRDGDPLNNYLDYYLYYSVEGDLSLPFYAPQTLCLEKDEMNAYYTFMNYLMFDILPNEYLPDVFGLYGYRIESLNSLYDFKYTQDDNTYYLHKADFTCGIQVGYKEGESPTEL